MCDAHKVVGIHVLRRTHLALRSNPITSLSDTNTSDAKLGTPHRMAGCAWSCRSLAIKLSASLGAGSEADASTEGTADPW